MYSFGSSRQHAIRVVISQDHIFKTKQKFFCDRPSEKKVHLKVRIIVTFYTDILKRKVDLRFLL